jgi:AAHS family 4-hydroxybenzoate transporter-like MFS transporter
LKLAAILNRLAGKASYSGTETFVLGSSLKGKGSARLSTLFSPGLARDTIAAWLIFGTNIFAVYAFFNWAPVVLTSLGFTLPTAVRGALVFNLAGVIGALALSWVISKFGSRRPLPATATLAVGAMLYLAWIVKPPSAGGEPQIPLIALMVGIAMGGFAINSIQIGMYAVTAHIYPTECRASGVGWALGIGRLGGIVSSFAGALLLGSAARESGFFIGIAVALIITLAGLLLLRRHIPTLAESSARVIVDEGLVSESASVDRWR